MKDIDVPDLQIPRVVIVGGGFGGLSLAKSLVNRDVQVVLIDRNNYHTFQPLLYQVATAGLEPDAIAYPIRKIFKHAKNFYFRMATVERVEASESKLLTNIGEIRYDYLVMANGSKTNFFGLDEVQQHAMPLKSVVQALDLRSLLLQNFEKAITASDVKEREARMNFVIVGGGPTGVELAGALAELKRHVLPKDYPELDVRRMQIHLVEMAPRLLNGMADKSGQKSLEFLKKLDVHVWLNTSVKDYDGMKVVMQAQNGEQKDLFAKNFIWSAGVQGNLTEGIDASAIVRGNRVMVNEFNKVKGYENVFAIGDIAAMLSPEYPNGHPMVAPVAMQQGEHLAKNLMASLSGKEMKPFAYFDKGSMATIGKNRAVVEVSKFKSQGAFAWFIWMFVHIATLVGFRNRMIVLVNWLWNYVNYDRGIRLIIRPFNKIKGKIEAAQLL